MRRTIVILLPLVWLTPACFSIDPTLIAVAPTYGERPHARPPDDFPRSQPEAPKLRRLENGHYRVTHPWTVELGANQWEIQRGYTSNGITAPRTIKRSLGDGVDYPETWAAVFHDWLFTQAGVSRDEADRHFYDLLIAFGVPQQKARLMHSTVSAYSLAKSRP